MRAREIEHFKRLLQKEKAETARELKYFEEHNLRSNPKESSGDISSYATHPADQGQGESDYERAFILASKMKDRLYAIDAALERIKNNEYGICIACNHPIQKERLQAIPWTELCIECQVKLETNR